MVAAVETMAYVGQVPWHGLGNPVPQGVSIEEMQKAAGLDWTVSKRPVMFSAPDHERTEHGGIKLATFKDKFVLARDTDNKPFSVVSSRYKPVQPKEIMEFFRELVEQQGFKLHTAGALLDGGRIWCLAETGDFHLVNKVDRVDSYLLLSTSYDLTLSTLAQFTSVRVVCNNTLQQALRDATGRVTIPHVRDFNAAAIKTELGINREQFAAFSDALDTIARINLDAAKAVQIMDRVFELPEDPEKRMADSDRIHAQNVIDMFTRGTYIGSDLSDMTGWGLVNAMTEYVDFRKRARGQGSRLDSAWFGDNAKLKSGTLNAVLELAA